MCFTLVFVDGYFILVDSFSVYKITKHDLMIEKIKKWDDLQAALDDFVRFTTVL